MTATDYLDDWSAAESGWLRRFYPANSDEVHYDATPDFEKAYSWVSGLTSRPFIGTESRLQTVVALLREIVHGAETDPQARLAELERQREHIDSQIAEVKAGRVSTLEPSALRERYHQASSTARELLSDFREVEANFRALDRDVRQKIASWDGSKGDLISELVSNRGQIDNSDQGRSFQAFHDYLLSQSRQDELDDLLGRVQTMAEVDTDRRLGSVHHDWSVAAERTQQTVRQLSQQLRSFLDEQTWLENRRVLDLVKSINGSAIACRNTPPAFGLETTVPGIEITLPFERPLYSPRVSSTIESRPDDAPADELDMTALFSQTFVDQARLAQNVRAVVPQRSSATLSEIIEIYPVDQGVAEIIGYLALTDEDIRVAMDDTSDMVIDYDDIDRQSRRLRLPLVTVSRP